MKRLFTILISIGLLMLSSISHCQQTISDLTSNSKQESADMLQTIYSLDVFSYFNLDSYDTELKKAVFKKTSEYQNYLTQLKNLKAEMLKTIYYVKIDDAFTNNDYNIKRGGFEINLGENDGLGTASGKAPKTIDDILLKNLSTKWVSLDDADFHLGVSKEILFIPLSQTDGLEVENDKQNIGVFFFFTPSGIQKSTFKWLVLGSPSYAGWYNLTSTNVYADNVKIVVANKETGKIYYDNGGLKQEFEKYQTEKNIKEQAELEQQRKIDEEQKIKQDEQNKIKKEEDEKQLLKFLAERKAKTYDYSEISDANYVLLKSTVENTVYSIARNSNQDNINYKAEIIFKIDTNNITTYKINTIADNKELENKLISELAKVKMEPCLKNGYSLNTECKVLVSVSKSKEMQIFSIKYMNNDITLINSDNANFGTRKNFIVSEMANKSCPSGKYKVEYDATVFNEKREESLKIIEYKGFGGPQYSLVTLVVPGVGDYFVNRGSGSFFGKHITPWVTTIGALGFVGAGVFLQISSQNNYTLYHSATQQSDINNYYDMANGQNMASYYLIGAGALIWAVDIYWVIKKGISNKNESKQFKNKMQLAISPSMINETSFAVNLKIKF